MRSKTEERNREVGSKGRELYFCSKVFAGFKPLVVFFVLFSQNSWYFSRLCVCPNSLFFFLNFDPIIIIIIIIIIILVLARNMKRRMCCFLMATLQITIITTWHISATTTSRPFASYPQQEKIPEHPEADLDLKQGVNNEGGGGTRYRGESRLGSRPPSCEHKCGGCNPCVAIQIPATADHMGVQYANYEPEGWKCKCGTVFFNP